MSAVVDRVRGSLVQIRNGHRGTGAGTIWHDRGLIVTNAHVVGHGDVKVTLPDGRTLPGKVLAIDPDRDLAAIMVDATDLPTIQPGNAHDLQPGQWVVAIGHPWGVTGAISAGAVIGLGPAFAEGGRPDREWVLASLHLRPGHSGGPHGRCGGTTGWHQYHDQRPGRRCRRAGGGSKEVPP